MISFDWVRLSFKFFSIDFTPVNATARVLGPTQIKVTWKHTGEADQFVTDHQVFIR